MKRLGQSAVLMFTCLLIAPAHAGEGKQCKDKEKLEPITLVGELVSEQKEKKSKDGSVTTHTVYYVSTEEGKVHVPQPKAKKKGEAPAFNLADFDGAKVTIDAQGYTKTGKDGAKAIHLVTITEIKRVEA